MTTVTMPATIAEWDAEEWLCGTVLQTYGITAASNDYDLSEAAEYIDLDALNQNVRLIGTRKWLEAAHGELWAAAENAAAWARNSGV